VKRTDTLLEFLKNSSKKITAEAVKPELLIKQFDSAPLSLRFPKALERDFQISYANLYKKKIRVVLILFLLIFISSGIIDHIYAPDLFVVFFKARWFAAVFMSIAIIFSVTKQFVNFQQSIIILFIVFITAGLLNIGVINFLPYKNYYYYAIALVQLFAFIYSRILFRWAIVCTVILIIECNITWLWIDRVAENLLPMLNTNLIAASIVSLSAVFLLERSLRKLFLQALLINLQKKDIKEAQQLFNLQKHNLEAANVNLRSLIALDALTGIANRRSLDETLQSEWLRALRNGNPISFMMMDIDHFKQYNDTYGHQAGDECLKKVGGVFKGFARRPGDLSARYGGEEFAVLLADTELIDASIVATQVLHAIQTLNIPHKNSSASNIVTISVGLAVMIPQPNLDPSQLIASADRALYCAKHGGRNRVAVGDDTAPPTSEIEQSTT
jgi:diguanylate cyclase (GGDEF)-like protein